MCHLFLTYITLLQGVSCQWVCCVEHGHPWRVISVSSGIFGGLVSVLTFLISCLEGICLTVGILAVLWGRRTKGLNMQYGSFHLIFVYLWYPCCEMSLVFSRPGTFCFHSHWRTEFKSSALVFFNSTFMHTSKDTWDYQFWLVPFGFYLEICSSESFPWPSKSVLGTIFAIRTPSAYPFWMFFSVPYQHCVHSKIFTSNNVSNFSGFWEKE